MIPQRQRDTEDTEKAQRAQRTKRESETEQRERMSTKHRNGGGNLEIVVMETGARGRKLARKGAFLDGSQGWGPLRRKR